MFQKRIFVFGLLTLLTCLGESASSLNELINQVREVIASLEKLIPETIGDALRALGNIISTLPELRNKSLQEGIDNISIYIKEVNEFMKNKAETAAESGTDIGECLIGHSEQLKKLGSGLIANLTDCVYITVESARSVINNDINHINQFIRNIIVLPVELTKCLNNLRPITCITNMTEYVNQLLANLPSEISTIVSNANELVKALPERLTDCLDNFDPLAAFQTQAIINEIGACVDGIISGRTV